MKLPGGGQHATDRTYKGGTKRVFTTPEPRPDVVADDGTVYEVVWFPHRDALLLLGDGFCNQNASAECRKWK